MAQTLSFEVTDDSWTEIANGSEFVTVQRASVFPVEVHVGASAPNVGDPAILLRGRDRTFSLGGLDSNSRVYARARGRESTITVVRS